MSFVARCFPEEVSKTGRYADDVCYEVKILHSEQNSGQSAPPNSFWGECAVFLLSFLILFGYVWFYADRVTCSTHP